MATIKIPEAGKAVLSGTVRQWNVKPGDNVTKGEIVVELDTEEGLLQVEAPLSGRLGQILLRAGQTAPIHAPLAQVEEKRGYDHGTNDNDNTAGKAANAGENTMKSRGNVVPVLMPKAGQSMEEGTIVQWRVTTGSQIKKGDVIYEIETDKATLEVEATDAGRLARIVVADGGVLAVLQPVAYLADDDADVDAYLAAQGQSARGPEATQQPAAAQTGSQMPASSPAAPATTAPGERPKASPAARKIASRRGVDLTSVTVGSGPAGRIVSTDVPAGGTTQRRRMSPMRKAIARNLVASKQNIPHFYVRVTVDAAPAVAFYQAQKALFPCSINDLIVMACSRVIQEFPAFRSRVEGDEIVEAPSANIGIAVGMDEGLVVPVLLGAERLSLQQIGSETKRLAAAARSGKIEGMGQGCFTITNLGMFGTEEFAAIINPPEAAILAVGAAREAVVVKDGAMRPGKVMTMTLSADHRVVDGMLAAKFLARLKDLLEKPDTM